MIEHYLIPRYDMGMQNANVKIEQHLFTGGVWIAAWLFTIGFLKLTFWMGVLAIVIWPYYLGTFFSLLGR